MCQHHNIRSVLVLFLRLEFVSVCVSVCVQWSITVSRWALSPSVRWDVMVGLRRTQESKPLLVLPLFSHLWRETGRQKKREKNHKEAFVYVAHTSYANLWLCHYSPIRLYFCKRNILNISLLYSTDKCLSVWTWSAGKWCSKISTLAKLHITKWIFVSFLKQTDNTTQFQPQIQ